MEPSFFAVAAGGMVVMSAGMSALVVSVVTVGVALFRLPTQELRSVPILLWVLLGVHVLSLLGFWPLSVLAAVPSVAAAGAYGLPCLTVEPQRRGADVRRQR